MSDLDTLIGSIAVLPFPKRKFNYSKMRIRAFVQCPKCHNVGNFYDLGKFTPFLTSYCKGNLPPEINHKDMLGQTCTHQVNCAGVTVEHFHVKCGSCDFTFFLGLPETK